MARPPHAAARLIPWLFLLPAPGAATAQERPALREHGWRLALAGAYTTPLVRDANGTEVRAPWGLSLGAGSAWTVAPRVRLGVEVRGGVAPLVLSDDGGDWDAGTSWSLDLVGSIERAASTRIALRVGLGAMLLRGPDDVLPFRDMSGMSTLRPMAEMGALVRVAGARPLSAALTLQAVRVGPAVAGGALDEAGAVARLLLGVRHGR